MRRREYEHWLVRRHRVQRDMRGIPIGVAIAAIIAMMLAFMLIFWIVNHVIP